MCAVENARIHHSHSRSRQLVSLPVSPHSSHKPSFRSLPPPKGLLRALTLSKSRFLRTLALCALAAFSFALVQTIAPLHAIHAHVHSIPVRHPPANPLWPSQQQSNHQETNPAANLTDVQQPPVVNTSADPLAVGALPVDAVRQQGVVVERGQRRRPTDDSESSAESVARQKEDPAAPTASLSEPDLKKEVRGASQLDYRDPADFASFTNNTSLNYFHLHKTGGVSFKERLFDFFMLHRNLNGKGLRARVFDTCHVSGETRPALGIEAQWSCDWGEIQDIPQHDRNKIDVVLGHQYWEQGADYWIPNRDVRHFTVVRHPLHRKVSFYYHFFARNTGRDEKSVTEKELIQFVLGKDMPRSPLIRDAGPGYYASRLWSDGLKGYGSDNIFKIPEEQAAAMVENSVRRLRRNFVFIGLQTQEHASLCMLQKTVEAFSKAHQFSNLVGLEDISKQRERLNTGSYPFSAKILWNKMTEEQQNEFRKVERVDLAIYKESVKMFHEMAKKFECEQFIVDTKDDDIAL